MRLNVPVQCSVAKGYNYFYAREIHDDNFSDFSTAMHRSYY